MLPRSFAIVRSSPLFTPREVARAAEITATALRAVPAKFSSPAWSEPRSIS